MSCVARRVRYAHLLFGEDVPEAQRLISGARDDRRPIGADGQIQHAHSVPTQGHDGRHGRIGPHDYLILRVTVCADQLVDIGRPRQIADLGSRIYMVQ